MVLSLHATFVSARRPTIAAEVRCSKRPRPQVSAVRGKTVRTENQRHKMSAAVVRPPRRNVAVVAPRDKPNASDNFKNWSVWLITTIQIASKTAPFQSGRATTLKTRIQSFTVASCGFNARTANRNFADDERGLARCSAGDARTTSSAIDEYKPSRSPCLKASFTRRSSPE